MLKDSRQAIFKVIAVVEGSKCMQSEVACKIYTIRENLHPIPIEKEDHIKKTT